MGSVSDAIKPEDHSGDAVTHSLLGAAAGLLGTFVIQGLLTLNKKFVPSAMPPMRRDPGEFVVHQSERALPTRMMQAIPESAEKTAAASAGLAYGAMFGAAYGTFRGRTGNTLAEGALLGLGVWAAGYLGWLPATGLTPPPWKQKPQQVAASVTEHVLYGVATATAYDVMHRMVHGDDA
jgi:hypothetical protein